jgi:hypothetical protein
MGNVYQIDRKSSDEGSYKPAVYDVPEYGCSANDIIRAAVAVARGDCVCVAAQRVLDGSILLVRKETPLPDAWYVWVYHYGAEQTLEISEWRKGLAKWLLAARKKLATGEVLAAVEKTGVIELHAVTAEGALRNIGERCT